MAENRKIKFLVLGVGLLVLANFFVWREVWGVLGGNLQVIFFDVGQGDSIFIETPEGHQILIDGGPSGPVILEKLARTLPFWVRTIDLVVLTHPDYDHLRGLNDVLEKYQVKNVLWTGGEKESKTFDYWLNNLEVEQEQGAKVYLAQAGQVVGLGDSQLYILYPKESLAGQSVEKWANDSSIVSKLVFGRTSFLLPGDIGQKIEKSLVDQAGQFVIEAGGLDSNVLKIAHHGSKYSSASQFIAEVSPQIAIISCGKDNAYGHPHPEVLSNLKEFGITVLRTDQLGDIQITSNGQIIKVD